MSSLPFSWRGYEYGLLAAFQPLGAPLVQDTWLTMMLVMYVCITYMRLLLVEGSVCYDVNVKITVYCFCKHIKYSHGNWFDLHDYFVSLPYWLYSILRLQ